MLVLLLSGNLKGEKRSIGLFCFIFEPPRHLFSWNLSFWLKLPPKIYKNMKKFSKEEFYTYNLFLNKGLYTSLVCEYKPAILSTGSEGFIELAVSSCLLTDISHYTIFVDQMHDHNKQN